MPCTHDGVFAALDQETHPGLPSKPHRRRPVVLDEIDRSIVSALMHDGRQRVRVMAEDIGVTEATIAARMKSLEQRRLLGVTAVIDWRVAGYNWDGWIGVTTRGRPLNDVGKDIAELDGVHSVSLVFGPVDFLVHVLVAGTADDLKRMVQRVGKVPGVNDVESHVALDTLRYTAQYARLPILPHALRIPRPLIEVDKLDRELITSVSLGGRRSNRQIARELEVSEGTVRARLRRLEDTRLLRIVGQIDPYLTGLVNTWTYTWVDTDEGANRFVAERLATLSDAFVVALVSGHHDLLLGLFAPSKSGLIRTVADTVRAIPEVKGTQTWEVVRTIHYNFQWVRLV